MYCVEVEGEFTVVCEKDKSLLSTMMDSSLNAGSWCEVGQCNRCIALLLKGEVSCEGLNIGVVGSYNHRVAIKMCQSTPTSDVCLRYPSNFADTPVNRLYPGKVCSVNRVTDSVTELVVITKAQTVEQFSPGQHYDLVFKSGDHRSYSVFEVEHSPEAARIKFIIRRKNDGLYSDHWINAEPLGQMVMLKGPLGGGAFHRVSESGGLFLAIGTGLVPVYNMVKHLITSNGVEWVASNVRVFWAMRDDGDLRWAQLNIFPSNIVRVIRKSDGQRLEDLVWETIDLVSGKVLYACGPLDFIQRLQSKCIDNNFNQTRFFYEVFNG